MPQMMPMKYSKYLGSGQCGTLGNRVQKWAHSFRVAIMTTEQTVVSFRVVVVNLGRIHSTKVLSTTCIDSCDQ